MDRQHRSTRPARRLPALTALLCAATAAPAADDPYPRRVGDWTIAISDDATGCFVTRDYGDAGTTLLFGLDRDGANRLTVLNPHWSIRPKERLKLDFTLSGGAYPRHFAIGIATDGKQGFVTGFEAKFPAYLATSHRLDIARGKTPVERLPLDGSGAAIRALRECTAAQKPPARPTPPERDSRGIPRDPFAPAAHR